MQSVSHQPFLVLWNLDSEFSLLNSNFLEKKQDYLKIARILTCFLHWVRPLSSLSTSRLLEPVQRLLEELKPRPNCIISDMCLPYTAQVAKKLGVPRIAFNGFCCFSMLCVHCVYSSGILESVKAKSEYFVIPGLPHHIELTKEQLPEAALPNAGAIHVQLEEAEKLTYGILINSFEELEAACVREYKKVKRDKVWCIGPVSLYNKNSLDKVQRGNKASIEESECFKWLDSKQPGGYCEMGKGRAGWSLVKREAVARAIERLMDEGEAEERRKRAKEFSIMAKNSMEEDGSSYLNMELLIQDILQQKC
ncbi:hypothetical protein GH714_028970 [Hevea brasiliensis]|uniref:Uncharacterized protein n=1 Tax=Hevea brasiliensis TaxID=3981 RepID=A0A6A6M545_HEVBR|nr:hypothetical protein GH714_028970 [Hevea brasiliensis]